MTDYQPQHAGDLAVEIVQDNPTKPWKAIAAFAAPAVVAFLDYIVRSGADELPSWLLLLFAALAAGVGTYVVRNPKVRKPRKTKRRKPARPITQSHRPIPPV